jgi:hypothetical protein
MSEHDLPDPPPSTEGAPATEQPMVAGAGLTFDALDSDTPLSAGEQGDQSSTDAASGGSAEADES